MITLQKLFKMCESKRNTTFTSWNILQPKALEIHPNTSMTSGRKTESPSLTESQDCGTTSVTTWWPSRASFEVPCRPVAMGMAHFWPMGPMGMARLGNEFSWTETSDGNRVINGIKVGKVHEVWIFLGEVLYISITPMHFFPVDTLWDGVSTPSAKPWVSQEVFGAARNNQLWRLNVTNNYNINQHYHWPTIDHHYITTRLLIRWQLRCTISQLLTIIINHYYYIYSTTILKHWQHFFNHFFSPTKTFDLRGKKIDGLSRSPGLENGALVRRDLGSHCWWHGNVATCSNPKDILKPWETWQYLANVILETSWKHFSISLGVAIDL
jgi:hypothetical protein